MNDFMRDQIVVAVLGVAIVGTVAAVVFVKKVIQGKGKRTRPHKEIWKSPITDTHSKEDDTQIRRRFNNVFAMMSADRRRELLEYYKRSHSCDITKIGRA